MKMYVPCVRTTHHTGIDVTHCIRQLDKNSNRWLESPLTEEDLVLREAANTLDSLDGSMRLNRSEERSI